MPETVESAPDKSRNSFADLLASLTGKLQSDGWDNSALEDDVTTISYEEALRSARRSRGVQGAAAPLISTWSETAATSKTCSRKSRSGSEKSHKGASITIRVTTEEHAQLQARAAAAEVSVSAYLRSCIFEAEALRAEVKGALAKIQSAQTSAGPEREVRRWRWGRYLSSAWWRRGTAEG